MTSVPISIVAGYLIWTYMSKFTTTTLAPIQAKKATGAREARPIRSFEPQGGAAMRTATGNLSTGIIIGTAAVFVTLAVALAVSGRASNEVAGVPTDAALQHTATVGSPDTHVHDFTIAGVWPERALRGDPEDQIAVEDLPVIQGVVGYAPQAAPAR